MIQKEQLKLNYQGLYCELGMEHPDTKKAKSLYHTYCMAEQQTMESCVFYLMDMLRSGQINNATTNICVLNLIKSKLDV